MDVDASGLGWFVVGLKGEAVLGVWTYEGVDVVLCNSLIPYRSHTFEVAGFVVSKIIPKSDQALNKRHQNEKKRITESYSTQKSNTAPGHGNYC